MRIGKFDRRITFQKYTESQSASGAITFTWTDYATCWAWCMSKDGQEFNEANKLTPKHFWIIKTRFRDDIKEADRIIHGGKILNITSVSFDSSRAKMTEFLCSEQPVQE